MSLQGTPQKIISGLLFPEGPRWYDGALWYAETRANSMFRWRAGHPPELMLTLDEPPSSSGRMPDGSIVVASLTRRLLLRWRDGDFTTHADLSGIPGDFLNDMVADDSGRIYIGSRYFDKAKTFHPPEAGRDSLLVVEADGTATVAAEGLTATNGMVITPDGRTLIVAETYGHRLTQFDRDASGRLGGRRIFAQMDGVYPDGICLDASGAVWVASPYSGEFVRVREGGSIEERIAMEGAVACALGGENRRTLFLLTVDPPLLGDHSADPSEQPGGAIHAVKTTVGGAGLP